jgi:GNAT superfamily N-acetyltransferase
MEICVRPLQESDLAAADYIMRLAFGTFFGLPEPSAFMGDAGYVRTRWKADPTAAFAAEVGGELVGSNFASNWGSVGFFGPLTVHPDMWDRSVGKYLVEAVMNCFRRWGTVHAGLYTFAQSPRHVGLYQRFGFWPRFLTAVMSKPVQERHAPSQAYRVSSFSAEETEKALNACRNLTNSIYDGLDVSIEIRSVADQRLGDTVLLWDDSKLVALAVSHCGPGTEAGSGRYYIKFGAVRPGPSAEQVFERLLDACEQLASVRGLSRIVAGVNTGCLEAYRTMMAFGFRTDLQGIAMHRSNDAGYHRAGVFVIDDWR